LLNHRRRHARCPEKRKRIVSMIRSITSRSQSQCNSSDPQ
jgi:hypothetical protein